MITISDISKITGFNTRTTRRRLTSKFSSFRKHTDTKLFLMKINKALDANFDINSLFYNESLTPLEVIVKHMINKAECE